MISYIVTCVNSDVPGEFVFLPETPVTRFTNKWSGTWKHEEAKTFHHESVQLKILPKTAILYVKKVHTLGIIYKNNK